MGKGHAARYTAQSRAAAQRPALAPSAPTLTFAQQAKLQSLMGSDMERFRQELGLWHAQNPEYALPLGGGKIENVDFTKLPLEELQHISFQGATFSNATMPDRNYKAVLDSRGAKFETRYVIEGKGYQLKPVYDYGFGGRW